MSDAHDLQPMLDSRAANAAFDVDDDGMSLAEMFGALRRRLLWLMALPLAVGLLAFGAASLVTPTFTAVTTLLPPQQAQSAAASALASLGPLAGLAGGASGSRSSADQFVALMQSVTVSDRIVDRFNLMAIYKADLRVDARSSLAGRVRVNVGKKDGLITIEVDDHSPQRAADMANQYVTELRSMTATLSVTEAQQRRVFFERKLQESRDLLAKAQAALQSSGINAATLRAEPKAAAEGYARLKAEVTAAELRLQGLRGSLADGTPEVRQQQTLLSALREQLGRAERASDPATGPDYISKFREFKYQETLFELYARQFELARADESREGMLIQVVDAATPPEKKSKPRRATIAIGVTVAATLLLILTILVQASVRRQKAP